MLKREKVTRIKNVKNVWSRKISLCPYVWALWL